MLLLQLSVEGFDGPAWERLVADLYDYANRTLHHFFVSGLLPLRVRQATDGQPGAEETVRAFITATETGHHGLRDEVVAETLSRALSYWRRRVIPERRWNAAEGAQLRTYFVNLALKRLVKVAGRELRRLRASAPVSDPDAAIDRTLAALALDPSRARDLTDLERRIFALKADGYTHQEIAVHLRLTSAKAVESRVGRCRERLLAS